MSEIISVALKSSSKRARVSKELANNPSSSVSALEDLLDGFIATAPSTPSGSTEPGLFEFDEEGNIVFSNTQGANDGSVDFGTAVATEITGYEHAYKRTAPIKWTSAMDTRFYEGLCRFGSDLSLVGSLFPEIPHSHIRSKFKREDKRNSDKVTQALRQAKLRRTVRAEAPLPPTESDHETVLTPRSDRETVGRMHDGLLDIETLLGF